MVEKRARSHEHVVSLPTGANGDVVWFCKRCAWTRSFVGHLRTRQLSDASEGRARRH